MAAAAGRRRPGHCRPPPAPARAAPPSVTRGLRRARDSLLRELPGIECSNAIGGRPGAGEDSPTPRPLSRVGASGFANEAGERRARDQTGPPQSAGEDAAPAAGAGLPAVLSRFPAAPVLTSAPRLVRQREAPPPRRPRGHTSWGWSSHAAHLQAPPPLPRPALPLPCSPRLPLYASPAAAPVPVPRWHSEAATEEPPLHPPPQAEKPAAERNLRGFLKATAHSTKYPR
ncbi:sterile alpha motif domain-containing protein 1-like [Mustela nigripes]|uniref:sterile alpha motif domain-containing protein 1-like n=1 Tax=Mustela nigripes TaxID=77151 RepID=UPI0028152226|nr:sterile alpha motif domain-containing protein 1-like [Mustela nigripes]